MRFYQI